MESPPQQIVYTWDTTIAWVGMGTNGMFGMQLRGIPATFWVRDDPEADVDDRVKITITKEPADAQLSRSPQ